MQQCYRPYHTTVAAMFASTTFGSPIASRAYASGEYRYGFNGYEKDDGIKGAGNSIDFGERIYDSRISRFLSADPLSYAYPSISCYLFAINSPITFIDIDGLEAIVYTYGSTQKVADKNTDQHAVIAIRDEKEGLIVYSYGRYTDDNRAIGSPGVLIKLTGKEAEAEIAYILKHADGKATKIENVDEKKVKEYFEEKLDKGRPLTSKESKKYSKDSKTHKARVINKYNIANGNICSGEVMRALKAGGYNPKKELSSGGYTKKQKVLGILKIQYSVQILQARLNKTAAEDVETKKENNKDKDTSNDKELKGVTDVTKQEKKSAGSSLSKP